MAPTMKGHVLSLADSTEITPPMVMFCQAVASFTNAVEDAFEKRKKKVRGKEIKIFLKLLK